MFARLLHAKKLSQVLTASRGAAGGSPSAQSPDCGQSASASVPPISNTGMLEEPAVLILDWVDEQRAHVAQLFVLQPALPSVSQWITSTSPRRQSRENSHQQQLEDILTPEERGYRLARRKTNDRKIKVALTSLALVTVGTLYWPLKLLCLPCLFYITSHWYHEAYQLAKQRKVGVSSIFVIANLGLILQGYILLPSLAALVAQLSIKLTNMVTEDSRRQIIDIFRQAPQSVWVVVDGVEIQLPLDQVRIGQTVIVNAGEIIPIDGTVFQGMATVDQHLLTGEARPVEKGVGEAVFAGTVLLSGRLGVMVEKAGEQTAIAQIGAVLNNTTEYKSTAQLRAETVAYRTVVPTLIAGAVALPILGPTGAVAVLGSHFLHRLSLLSPLALMNYLNIASRHGILIKDGRSLELVHQVDTLVFDKTGTLTEEQPSVGGVHVCAGYTVEQILIYTATAEQQQTHPIAKAILAETRKRHLSLPALEETEYKTGYGLTVKVEGRQVRVGSNRFMLASDLVIPATLAQIQDDCHHAGHSLVMVACDGAVVGAIELVPTVRPEAKQMIRELRERHGITATYIISGDHEAPTRKLARELDIDHYFAETLPEQKADLIERLIQNGRFVCYVGDGINDAIALKKSHVSISLTGASSVAVDTAQIILMEGDLKPLVSLFDFARGFRANTNTSFAIVLSATLMGIYGAFFLHFGIAQATILGLGSSVGGVGNAMLPLLRHRMTPADKRLQQ